ncbi:MAG: hypothetical protein OXI67_13925 [Candidatus Poribacteria bacterium]|nr:hypothetical protein [Candidatus Poribacteria bacterium]
MKRFTDWKCWVSPAVQPNLQDDLNVDLKVAGTLCGECLNGIPRSVPTTLHTYEFI